MQLRSGVHVCPSEREGYGLYIAEARAAGALVIAPDHAPMSEQVAPATGVLIRPERLFSHRGPPAPALARYGNLSASVSADGICAAVEEALKLSAAERAARGAAARAAFRAERRAFAGAMARLKATIEGELAWLRQRGAAASAAAAEAAAAADSAAAPAAAA